MTAPFPVEVVNLETTVWTGPVIGTLIVAVLAGCVSVASLGFQIYQWQREGGLLRLTAVVRPGVPYRREVSTEARTLVHMLQQSARHVVVARNMGRQDAFVGPLFLAVGDELRDRMLVRNLHTFPDIAERDRVLAPGDYVEALIDPQEVWDFCESFGAKLNQVRFVTDSLGRPNAIKLPREFRRELGKFEPQTDRTPPVQ